MKIILLLTFLISNFIFCQQIQFERIDIDTSYSFRGLSVVNDSIAWACGNGFGKSINGGRDWTFSKIMTFENLDFRSIYAFDKDKAIIANAGSPAMIFSTIDGGENWKKVYENSDSLAFIDGMDFWDEKKGIVYADPIHGRILLLITNDGGQNWVELPESSRPELAFGEASFAASGTGIRCFGNSKVIIATGGLESRLLISEDQGNSWTSIRPPIIKGSNSRGIFSFDFMNENYGIIVGGDYLLDTLKINHVFYTDNGGKDWKSPDNSTGGYRECVEFIGDGLAITVGPGGAEYSNNFGKDWAAIQNENSLHVIRKARNGKLVVAAGRKKISIVKF